MKCEVKLTWYGPYRWFGNREESVFDSADACLQGVYLWAIPFEGGYLTYYVGETGKSFSERLREHAQGYLSGDYRAYEPGRFAQGEKKLVWRGGWHADTRHLWHEFLTRYVELAPVILAFLAQMRIFLAPLETDARTRRRIEGAISRALDGNPPPVGGFQEREVRYARRKPDETPVLVRSYCPEEILGLPPEIVA